MIIVNLKGGLGNQMFQYAVGRALSLTNNTELKLDLDFLQNTPKSTKKRNYELAIFPIKAEKATLDEIRKLAGVSKVKYLLNRYLNIPINPYPPSYIEESSLNFNNEITVLGDNIYLDGYWQSEKYFKECEQIIRKDFVFKNRFEKKNSNLLKKIKSTESVSLHVRRGDYVNNKKTSEYHGFVGEEYYRKATELMGEKVKNPFYFVFSDDIKWCKKKLGLLQNFVFVDKNKGYEDIRLMSNCKHNIIANSSFSWWGAWLNDHPGKVVIAPQKWFNDLKINIKDRFPKSWIIL